MNKFELIGVVSKYVAVVSVVFLVSKFGLNISFDDK
jgi:hypothetical protein